MIRIENLTAATVMLIALTGSVQGDEPPADALRVQSLRDLTSDEYEAYEAEWVQKNVARLLAAKNSEEAGAVCRDLFYSRHVGYLQELSVHDNANVAIQAAWCLHSRTIPRRHAYFGGGDFDLRYFPDLQRFLGFLEGRLRVSTPEWWERAAEDLHSQLPDERHLPRAGWEVIPPGVIRDSEPVVTLSLTGSTPEEPLLVKVPVESLRWLIDRQFEPGRVAIGLDARQSVLMSHNDFGLASELLCIDAKNSTERWRTKTWALGPNEPRTGPPITHYVSIVMGADRVFVFGATMQGAYIEAFDLKDGTNIARFATTNWFVQKEEEQWP